MTTALLHYRTTVRDPKIDKIDNIHTIHAPTIQEKFFFLREPKRRRQLTQPQRAWGALKSLRKTKPTSPNSKGSVLSEGAEAPQAADTDAKGWGTLKPANKYKFQKHAQIQKLKNQNIEIGIGTVSTCPQIKISNKTIKLLNCLYIFNYRLTVSCSIKHV